MPQSGESGYTRSLSAGSINPQFAGYRRPQRGRSYCGGALLIADSSDRWSRLEHRLRQSVRPPPAAPLAPPSHAPPPRPPRPEMEPVALDLIKRRGAEVLAGARRYASTPDDAEDAYQRALEILLTKAPTTREDELLPWLKTVVRHECYALRKKRERDILVEREELDRHASGAHAAEERAEGYDRLRVGAEALGRLKPQESKALLMKAEGMSYREIAAQTGWTYTKVNRCLVEGRRAFVARVEGIDSGAECERL